MAVQTEEANEEQDETNGEAAREEKSSRRKRKRKRKNKAATAAAASAANDQEQHADHQAEEEQEQKTEQLDLTVFVEGIPFGCTKDDVCGFFHGVELVDVRLPVFPDTGRLKGYGHVVLATEQDRNKALDLSGKYLQKRFLTITPAKAPRATSVQHAPASTEPSNTLQLNNLSYDATEDDIAEVLGKFGDICDGGVRIARHNATKQSRGFAFCEFESMESAKRAVNSAPIVICGRACRVEFDHGSVSSSFRTSTGRKWQKQYNKRQRN